MKFERGICTTIILICLVAVTYGCYQAICKNNWGFGGLLILGGCVISFCARTIIDSIDEINKFKK